MRKGPGLDQGSLQKPEGETTRRDPEESLGNGGRPDVSPALPPRRTPLDTEPIRDTTGARETKNNNLILE
jgi:hypothetical protein